MTKKYRCYPGKALATFGDVNFIDYGGQLLVPGVEENDPPYLEVIIEPPDDQCEGGNFMPEAQWEVYRVEPEQLQLVEVDRKLYLVCKNYKPDWPHPAASYDEWFHEGLESVANCVGSDLQTLRAQLCSDDPKERAQAYIDMASYHGWYEFDQYPLHLTQHEVHERYGMLDNCQCAKCSE